MEVLRLQPTEHISAITNHILVEVWMIIKGLFRRYERWNPVHPTSGAFWGMGFGVGCGVGWGPGFGPEVIGYVGAGCGIGFNVGITLVGVGVGLPANSLVEAPYNALMATRNGVSEITRSPGFARIKVLAEDGRNSVAACISHLQREAGGRFSDLSQNTTTVVNINNGLSSNSLVKQIEEISNNIFRR